MGKGQSKGIHHLHLRDLHKPSTVDMSTSTGSLSSCRNSERAYSESTLLFQSQGNNITNSLKSNEDEAHEPPAAPLKMILRTTKAESHLVEPKDMIISHSKGKKSRSAPSLQSCNELLGPSQAVSYLSKAYAPKQCTVVNETASCEDLPKPPQKVQIFNMEMRPQEMGDFLSSHSDEEHNKNDANNNVLNVKLKLTESQADKDCMLPVASSTRDDGELNELGNYLKPEIPPHQKMPQFIVAKVDKTKTNKVSTASTIGNGSVASSFTSTGTNGKKKLVVKGLKNFLSSRNAGYPPSWVRDFPCKSKFHPDNFLYEWDEGPSAVRKPGGSLTQRINACPKRGARCDSCGLYSEDSCRCCKKCPWDCDCPKPPSQMPDVMGQFGSGWSQANKVICEMTRDERRAPIGGSAAKRNARVVQKEFSDPFENSINVMRPNEEMHPQACSPSIQHPQQNFPHPSSPAHGGGYFNPYSGGYPYAAPPVPAPPFYPTYCPQPQPQMFPYAPPMMPSYQSSPQVSYPYHNSYNYTN